MSNVLIVSHDYIRKAMAGPAIRNFELAHQTHRAGHRVTLAVPESTDIDEQPFEVIVWGDGSDTLRRAAHAQDVVLVQGWVLERNMWLFQTGARIVVDIYDPFHYEFIAANEVEVGGVATDWPLVLFTLSEQLRTGDFFLCASERQRDMWIGALSMLNRINHETYVQDPTLRSLIGVVPFGLSAEPPRKVGSAYRGVVPGIGADDFVLLWGGGIYNWFDPLTLIRAVGMVAESHPQVRLFFMATAHPSEGVPEMAMVGRAVDLARELGLEGNHVFFNEEWVPYDRRQDYLLEADVGVSTHYEHLETRYSFRTRILDYLWAGLPVLCTSGDSLADLVELHDLGVTVGPEDEAAAADAIRGLIDKRDERHAMADRVRAFAVGMTWDKVAEPFLRYCDNPTSAADLSPFERRTDGRPLLLRNDAERLALSRGENPDQRPLPQRVARVLRREGPVGVARRMAKRLG
ncbi:MAG TPA: glycosyltransferase [Candidatus Dormibacteraeota bacterium]|jgi:glycosyltransferase involved in cell wall biosynthesis|nr:glycosyltransferase [Candidatus Dormibacteraeota bacterium]